MKMFMLTLFASVLAVATQAQDTSLANQLNQAGAEWLMGTWTGSDSDGQKITLSYQQEFNGQAGSMHLQSAEMEVKALIAVDPYSGEIREFGISNAGALVTGTWDDQGSGPAFEATWTLPDGSRQAFTYVHQWVDAKTMRIVVYKGSAWGGNIEYELTMKRAS